MSPSRLFTAILFIALFTMTVREISDPDFWWHLRAGEYFVETGTIPHTDVFSFTATNHEWVTHEWLSEVFIYALYRVGGFALLTLFFSGIITAAFALVYWRSEGRPYLAGFALILGALATAPTWGVRPQMLSLLLMSIFLFLLDTYNKTSDPKLLIPIPLLMILWVNLHSGYALGLVVVAAYLFGAIVQAVVERRALDHENREMQESRERVVSNLQSPISDSSLSLHAAVPLALTFVLAFLAVLINPNGARMYAYPFETLTSAAMQRYIQEWFSPDFHQLEWLPFALLIFAIVATALVTRAKVSLADALLLALFGLAGLRSVRNIPLFAVVAIPVLSAQLAALIPLRSVAKAPPRLMQIVNFVLLIVIALVATVRVVGVLGTQANIERTKFPEAAVEWIQQNHPSPNLYNSYNWGGYLIWKLYPTYRVYIDGRADVYGDTFIENFLDVYRASANREKTLEDKDVQLVLIEPDAPLATALATSPNWAQVFADSQSVIYEKK